MDERCCTVFDICACLQEDAHGFGCMGKINKRNSIGVLLPSLLYEEKVDLT